MTTIAQSAASAGPAKPAISFFERYLTLWVFLCIVAGIALGQALPGPVQTIGRVEFANVNLPVGVLIWVMIIPMLLRVDFGALREVGQHWRGIGVTLFINWAVKPFSMALLAWVFIRQVFAPYLPAEQLDSYVAGLILLAAAPCTAMVFVWSHLTKGNPAYTVVQVATNDLIILVAFTPIVALLLGIGGVTIPWDTLLLSVALFVVIPLAGGVITRTSIIKKRGQEYFEKGFLPKFNNITIAGLLLTLVIIFSFQGQVILENPLHIVLIAVPLVIQTFLIFFIAYGASKLLKLPHDIAAPAGMIGASNFFELAVAVAISLFGAKSPVALATIVGVLVEVPVMLTLVKIANRTLNWFPENTK